MHLTLFLFVAMRNGLHMAKYKAEMLVVCLCRLMIRKLAQLDEIISQLFFFEAVFLYTAVIISQKK